MKSGTLHLNLNPIKVFVKQQYLEDFQGGFGNYLSGEIVQVSSYSGHMPTFTVVLTDGTISSYLPVGAFTKAPLSCDLAADLAGMTCNTFCPSESFVLYETEALKFLDIYCWDKNKNYLDKGKYLWTMEWQNDNELCHLIELDSGQLVFVPNHKMLALPKEKGKPKDLPSWKKLHVEWIKKD